MFQVDLLASVSAAIANMIATRQVAQAGREAAGKAADLIAAWLSENGDQVKIWVVFCACLLCSAIGVAVSLLVFGSQITNAQAWGLGLVISIVMLGLSYGAKYANEEARKSFTPVDLIQYLSQGFLWPSTWPTLASAVGFTASYELGSSTWLPAAQQWLNAIRGIS